MEKSQDQQSATGFYQGDWEDFVAGRFWFLSPDSVVTRSEARLATEGIFAPTTAFVEQFPTLTVLLREARVTPVQVDGRQYHLYGWTGRKGQSLGWLCQLPSQSVQNPALHPDHRLLLESFGGIAEHWNTPGSSWLLNLWSALGEEASEVGIGPWDEYYPWKCQWDNLTPTIQPESYVTFAIEANGNRTLYHRQTAQVLMFAHDHNFDHIRVVQGCPEMTFYTIQRCPDLRAWVETIAHQWRRATKVPRPDYRAISRRRRNAANNARLPRLE